MTQSLKGLKMLSCYRCHEILEDVRRPSYDDICPKCSAYLHVCLNCKYYDEYAHNKCKSSTTEWVADRKGLNFCDEFQARVISREGRSKPVEKGSKELWEKLWKKTKD